MFIFYGQICDHAICQIHYMEPFSGDFIKDGKSCISVFLLIEKPSINLISSASVIYELRPILIFPYIWHPTLHAVSFQMIPFKNDLVKRNHLIFDVFLFCASNQMDF